jgi:hypothetical protein
MRSQRMTRLAALLAILASLAACDDFLSGPELTDDPNNPSTATRDQLFHAVQINTFFWQTGNLARSASMWVNQMVGTDRQYLAYDAYDFGEDEFNAEFDGVYIGGGLVDMRKVEALSEEQGDRVFAGVTRVYEALMVGTASSIWGALPYSEAVGEAATPMFDAQSDISAALQGVLDAAIADLQSGAGPGPGDLDLVLGGDADAWVEVAHTLKARFYMHWVEAENAAVAGAATACGGSCLTNAINAALDGISAPANDLDAYFTTTAGEQSMWYQFVTIFRPGYMSAGATLVDLLEARGDPRIAEYFDEIPAGGYVGGLPQASGSFSGLSATGRGASDYNVPIVTFLENELILAEAYARQGNADDARSHINAARAAVGLAPIAAGTAATMLQEAINEKYIATFQNIEAWNDMKRNCSPVFPPPADELISRIYYSGDERNANPNMPEETDLFQKNENDPAGCF